MATQNAWFVVAPNGASQGGVLNPQIPNSAKIVEVTVGSPAYNAWVGNGSYQGWQVVMGPFNTQAQAQSASPSGGLSYLGLLTQVAANTIMHQASNYPATSASAVNTAITSNPLDVIGHFNLGGWFLRVGEVLIGLVLIGVGVARMTGAQNIISSALKTKIIPL
jgi:hypothetical protein